MADNRPANKTPQDILTILAAYDRLAVQDQAEVLQKLVRKRREATGTTDVPNQQPVVAKLTPSDAHTCHICRQLRIVRKEKGDWPHYLESDWLALSKETLQQGLARKCVLVEWIFLLLARGLRDFKSDVIKRLALPSQLQTIRDASDDLEFVGSSGVLLGCAGYGENDEVNLQLKYDAEPILVDKLWNIDSNLHVGTNYAEFERRYDGDSWTRFRVSASAGTSSTSASLSITLLPRRKTSMTQHARIYATSKPASRICRHEDHLYDTETILILLKMTPPLPVFTFDLPHRACARSKASYWQRSS
jgi:hypothetical protein